MVQETTSEQDIATDQGAPVSDGKPLELRPGMGEQQPAAPETSETPETQTQTTTTPAPDETQPSPENGKTGVQKGDAKGPFTKQAKPEEETPPPPKAGSSLPGFNAAATKAAEEEEKKKKRDPVVVTELDKPKISVDIWQMLQALAKLFSGDFEGFYIDSGLWRQDEDKGLTDPTDLPKLYSSDGWQQFQSSTVPEQVTRFTAGLTDIIGQKTLLRPDLADRLATDTGHVRTRFDQIISAVNTYNASHTTQLDPYMMANQLWQESRFQDAPGHHDSVYGLGQIKVETANSFLATHPDAAAAIGKSSVTGADLENPAIAIPLAVNLMGEYTKDYGSQFAALFAYNGGGRSIGYATEELVKQGIIQQGQTPTIGQLSAFFIAERQNLDARKEAGQVTNERYNSRWAKQSLDYAILAYSPAWKLFGVVDNDDKPSGYKDKFTDEYAKQAMTNANLPLPEASVEKTEADKVPTPAPVSPN